MSNDIREAIALLRHQVISPVLVESGRAQAEYFRKIAQTPMDVPGVGPRYFSPQTMKGWLMAYRRHGFKGLMPKVREDRGMSRRMTPELEKQIREFRSDLTDLSVAKFHRRCSAANLLGEPPLCQETLRRFLKAQGLMGPKVSGEARKRYEMDYFGELWVADFMHGPTLKEGLKRERRAILLAIIDDHSRIIVGSLWSLSETTGPIEQTFKEALLKYGIADRLHTDNGPSFSSSYLRRVCAHLGIGLIHSKPYDPPSRGKVERFFRTVGESFLSDFLGKTLKDLNEKFSVWLRDEYHHKHHNGIDCRPVDRLKRSLMDYPRKRISEDLLEEFFLVSVQRKVKKDSTIAFQSIIYEVPTKYIGQKIEIRYAQDRPKEIFLYDQGVRITSIKAVDVRANAKIYKPKQRDTVVAYHNVHGKQGERS